jgi:tetratricopeptide (TPR) repeat protein
VRLRDGPLHTDNRPIIEYSAPKSALDYRVDLNLGVLLAHFQPVPEVYLKGMTPGDAAAIREAHEGLRTLLLGCIQRSTGDLRGSLELLRQAARQAPANPLVRTELTQTLGMLADEALSAGQKPEAEAWYREILGLEPRDYAALLQIVPLLRESQPEQAQEWLRLGLEAYPNDAQMLAMRGRYLGLNGDPVGASRDLQAALRVLPRRSDFWDDYAYYLGKAGRNAEAHVAAERAQAARAW